MESTLVKNWTSAINIEISYLSFSCFGLITAMNSSVEAQIEVIKLFDDSFDQ